MGRGMLSRRSGAGCCILQLRPQNGACRTAQSAERSDADAKRRRSSAKSHEGPAGGARRLSGANPSDVTGFTPVTAYLRMSAFDTLRTFGPGKFGPECENSRADVDKHPYVAEDVFPDLTPVMVDFFALHCDNDGR